MQCVVLPCVQKLARVSLIYHTEPTNKSGKKWKKLKKVKERTCSEILVTVRGVRPEEENEGYCGERFEEEEGRF